MNNSKLPSIGILDCYSKTHLRFNPSRADTYGKVVGKSQAF